VDDVPFNIDPLFENHDEGIRSAR